MLNIKGKVKILYDIRPDNIPDDILSSDEPLILKGFGSNWPLVIAAKRSNDEAASYLKELEQGKMVSACYLSPKEHGRIFYNEDMSGFNFETKPQLISDVITQILQARTEDCPPTIYIGSTSINQVLPELVKQTTMHKNFPVSIYNLWMGNKSKVAAHFDFLQNLACCVVGKRRFTLFPPEEVSNLYVGPLDKAPGGQAISMFDFDNPDFSQFPRVKKALESALVAELETGDAILLPSLWWHHVEGLDDFNMLLNHWWRNSPSYLGNPSDALHHTILSVRDLPKTQKAAWKALFDHYVFDHEADDFEHIPSNLKSFLESPMDELTARKLRSSIQNKLRR
jgi:hypothetical protein